MKRWLNGKQHVFLSNLHSMDLRPFTHLVILSIPRLIRPRHPNKSEHGTDEEGTRKLVQSVLSLDVEAPSKLSVAGFKLSLLALLPGRSLLFPSREAARCSHT